MIVDTEKVLREADGPEEAGRGKTAHGWKGAPLEPDGESREEPEEHKRSHNLLYWTKKLLTDICGPGRD